MKERRREPSANMTQIRRMERENRSQREGEKKKKKKRMG